MGITMQGIIILANISTEKHTLVRRKILTKSMECATCRSRVPGQGVCLLSTKSRTITMPGFIILATVSTEKQTLVYYSTSRRKLLINSMESKM